MSRERYTLQARMTLLLLNRASACRFPGHDRGNFWEPVLKPQQSDACKNIGAAGSVGRDLNSGFYIDRNMMDEAKRCGHKLGPEIHNPGDIRKQQQIGLIQNIQNIQNMNAPVDANALGLPFNANTFGSPMMLVLILFILVLILFTGSLWR